MSSEQTSEQALAAMWSRQARGWHLGFTAFWLVTVVTVLIDPAGPATRVPELVMLVALAGDYVLLGAASVGRMKTPGGVAYILIAWALVLGMQAVNSWSTSWLLTSRSSRSCGP
ncbi:MAG: hypothetical protein ACK5MP_00360 [Nostocoides sp.]